MALLLLLLETSMLRGIVCMAAPGCPFSSVSFFGLEWQFDSIVKCQNRPWDKAEPSALYCFWRKLGALSLDITLFANEWMKTKSFTYMMDFTKHDLARVVHDLL